MSFFSYRNAHDLPPDAIQEDAGQESFERVCIQVEKVYDACLQQERLEDLPILIRDIRPSGVKLARPLCFVSCRSLSNEGVIRNLRLDPLPNRPNFARLRADIDIPIDVTFTDATGHRGTGVATVSVEKDGILLVPDESLVPYKVEATVSAVCVDGSFISDFRFKISICVTVIMKIVAKVHLLVPAYAFCHIPPCEEFAESVCDEFFNLPIFPPQPKR
ncbi:MAG: hypothetical protein ACOX6S_06815 [Clostridia bacterium]|jgi:hypothetical protein